MLKAILALGAALAAFAATQGIAVASPELQSSTGAKVATGTAIKATSVGNVVFTSSEGKIICTHSLLTGEVVENSGTSIKGTIKTASFTGTHDGTTNCEATYPWLTMVKITPENLHWCLNSTVLGSWSLRGGGCAEGAKGLKLTFDLFNSSTEAIGSCSYERVVASGPLTGTNNTGSSPLELTVTGGNTFVRLGESLFCPPSTNLDAKYKVRTSTEGELRIV
jgi:hypothetical protein